MAELRATTATHSSALSLKEAFKKYLERISVTKRGHKQEKYRVATISRTFLGKRPLAAVSSVDIANYRDMRLQTIARHTNRPISANTVRLELALLSDLFNIAIIEWAACSDNPVLRVRKPKLPPGRDRRVTWGEERRILRAAAQHRNPAIYSIIVLALETAMRQGEILGITWEFVNLRTRIVHLPITKNGTKRDVPLSLRAVDAITRMGLETSGSVFGYTSDGFKSAWRVLIQGLGIQDLHFHDLRHEAVSRLFELGTLDMMEVATISGHKSMQMLKRYTHLKASNLVAKLDGKKTLMRGKRVIAESVIPYPALVTTDAELIHIKFLDFDHLCVQGSDMEEVSLRAKDVLLRALITLLRDSKKAPTPTAPLDYDDGAHIMLVQPL